MSVQDKLERTLRDIHIMLSRGEVPEGHEEFVIIHKKTMQNRLKELNQVIQEMMDIYEVTKQSRAKAEREAVKKQDTILRDANYQAEDIYAASVLYTEDALGRIQDIMEEAGKSAKEVLSRLNREIEEEKRIVRSNQTELRCQLEDLKDTAKYLRIIEERNKEAAKSKRDTKASEVEKGEKESASVHVEIKVNEEYMQQAGLTAQGEPIPEETEAAYSKPEIHINEEYFKRAGIPLEPEEQKHVSEETEREGDTITLEVAEDIPEETLLEEVVLPDSSSDDKATEIKISENLLESLDMEYFEWKDNPEGEKEKKPKEGRKFPFGRKNKS